MRASSATLAGTCRGDIAGYGTAVGSLAGWRNCPRCGTPLAGDESRRTCSSCGSEYYAHSAPAVSAIVLDASGRVLLARRAHEPDAGLWDTPGGFLDEGEHPLDGLRRELLEETGLEIEPGEFRGVFIDRYGDGPHAVSVLNLVWEARVVAGNAEAADDVSELRWFAPDALPEPHEFAFRWVAPFFRQWASARVTRHR
jgi:8-oxo-dGTP diphosphatase